MKRFLSFVLASIMLMGLCACGGQNVEEAPVEDVPTWQEQYDLGIKYLSEGNYEEAIIAFTAVIEIDPKNAAAFSGRGRAYILSGETEENMAVALADFEAAVEADETLAEAWLGLADIYIRQGKYNQARDILKEALEKTGNDASIADKLAEMEAGNYVDMTGKTRRSSHFENGELIHYWLYEYDERGNNVKTVCYSGQDEWMNTEVSEFNEQGQEIRAVMTDNEGWEEVETFEYDSTGRLIKEVRISDEFNENGEESTQIYTTYVTYDDALRTQTREEYDEEGNFVNRFVIDHDENWVRTKGSSYDRDENGELYLSYYVEYIWNDDGSYGGFVHYDVANGD